MWPRAYTPARITKPNASETATGGTVPGAHAFTAAAPGPMNTSMNVPTASAASRGPLTPVSGPE